MKLPLVASVLSIGLAACGGGGSDGGNNNGGSGEYRLTIDNFVAVSSALYNASLSAASLVTASQALDASTLYLSPSQIATQDCSGGGTFERAVDKAGAAFSLAEGDQIESRYDDCLRSGDSSNGDNQSMVMALSGAYPNDDYVVLLRSVEDIRRDSPNAEDSGDYEYGLYATLSSQEDGDLELLAVNLAHLYRGISPELLVSDFANAILLDRDLPRANPIYFETPAARFDTFALEIITDARADDERISYHWELDFVDKVDDSGTHLTRTRSPLVLEERLEGDDDEIRVAIQGEFEFVMANGDIVNVDVNEIRAGLGDVDTVVVSLDIAGDGSVEATETLSWEDFERAFLFFGL